MWSPVFDGIWDFEAAVKLTLGATDVRAGVITDRLVVSEDDARDYARGLICGIYPYSRMFVLCPYPLSWKQVHSAEQLISLVESQAKMTGLIHPYTIGVWRRQAAGEVDAK